MFRRTALAATCVALLACAAYARLPQNDFVNWDDDAHILQDPVISAPFGFDTIANAFRFSERTYWMPTTTLSFAVDHALFGFDPVAFHLESLAWHIASAILVLLSLSWATGRLGRATFVAAVFAVHPINVESVAWAIERKNILSVFFGVAVLATYVRWCRRPRLTLYATILVLLALGMMAKALIATLPLALLAFDVWPLRRTADVTTPAELWKRRWLLVREKAPMLAVSALLAFVVRASFATASLDTIVSAGVRLANAPLAVVQQIFHVVFPIGLPAHHAYAKAVPWPQWAGAVSLILVISAAAFHSRRAVPYVFAGWMWFVAMLVPTLGIVQGGLFPPVADRFAYVAQLGILWAVAWGAGDLFERLAPSRRRVAAPFLAAIVVVALVAVTLTRTAIWRDSLTLFEHAVRDEPQDPVVRYNLGTCLTDSTGATRTCLNGADPARFREGIEHLKVAVDLDPSDIRSRVNLGLALVDAGRTAEAVAQLEAAVRMDPANAVALGGYADALMYASRFREALAMYQRALAIAPAQMAWRQRANEAMARIERSAGGGSQR